jgi:GNAT superfamily N-acetyltransferase
VVTLCGSPREDSLELYGYDDLAWNDNPARVAGLRDQREYRRLVLLAIEGEASSGSVGPLGHFSVAANGDTTTVPDAVLGLIFIEVSLHDNEHMGYIDLTVRPARRHQGIGSALLDAAESYLRSQNRTTFSGWSTVTSALSDDQHATIPDPTGTIRVSTEHDVVRFAVKHGYAFSQAERHSLQPLPVPEDVLTAALAEGEREGRGYELVQFAGMPPNDLLTGLAPLFAAMSTDAPRGDIDVLPEVWDADRVKHAYEQMLVGKDVYTTLARHVATREIVAFTQLKGIHTKPAVVFQENTLVLGPHRGQSLGLWVKAANCAYIMRERPSSRRVHTWTADVNEYMLAINTRLGYRRESIAAAWQKVLR